MTLLTIKWIFWGYFVIYIAYRAYNKYQDEFSRENQAEIQKEIKAYLDNEDEILK